jgi:hypothetical protein
VKLVAGVWGALPAPKRVTKGAGDKVFPGFAARAGRIAVTYYTRDYAATHNPDTCKVAIASEADGSKPIMVRARTARWSWPSVTSCRPRPTPVWDPGSS